MEAVAGGGLRDLRDQGLCVAQQHVAQFLIAIELLQQRPCIRLDRAASDLYDVFRLRSLASAHQGIDADHFTVADHTRLSRGAISHGNGDREEAINGEIEILDRLARMVEDCALLQGDSLQVGDELFVYVTG
ncbi:MAG: hypothetical protein ICV55_06710 [Coleofasciculus sp. C3-bin4]|nr:hypothetical protein [Coleofasciculus sp. C3-bin4]